MVYTISPLVEEAKRFRFYLASVLHVLGGLTGGAVIGGAFALAGALLGPVMPAWFLWLIVPCVTMTYALREFGIMPLPIWNLQDAAVPYIWRVWFGQVGAAFPYGFGLGLGFHAATPYGSFHLMLLWALALADWRMGALAGAVYGLSRTMQPFIWGLLWPSAEAQLKQADWLRANTRLVHRVNGGSLILAGLVGLLPALFGSLGQP